MRLAKTDTMQNALVSGFLQICENTHAPIILDAHTVIDKGKRLDKVKPSFFRDLGINFIVHLKEKPAIIFARRKRDKIRNRPNRTVREIERQQVKSIAQAAIIGAALNIPSVQLLTDQHNRLASVIYPDFQNRSDNYEE